MAPAAVHSELQLLFACARVSPDLELVRNLASQNIDWNRLAVAAEFHGLSPLLSRNLESANISIPPDVATDMQLWNTATVRQNLFLTSELLRVRAALQTRGVEAVPLKGPALASQLYGDVTLRPFSDIDLLIRREQLQEAEAAVRELNYEAEFVIPPEHREQWVRQQCELTFRRSGTIRLELHWDIAHPHFALDTGVDGFWLRLSTLRIGDATLPNLSAADLLFTLIVHGTRHSWSRMMWLVDVAELLRREPAIDWEEFWQNASSRGAARMMVTGLLLAERALSVQLPNAAQEQANHEAALGLSDQVIAQWNAGFEQGDSADLEPTALWRHHWIMHTRENRRQRWAYAGNVMMMVGDEEFSAVRLPGGLAPLYKFVRFWNVLRRARPSARAASVQSQD